ncbi:MAG TPA: DUF1844 domain-containing protein [Pyrinomonadaceae bacterium]|nr:DUF1844 domain-containing protein [Pyrinomonadaceae bacterium]
MIGRDDSQEEVSFKVTDRRKFNADGSVKDGVVIEPAPPKTEEKPPEAEVAPPTGAEPTAMEDTGANAEAHAAEDGEPDELEDIPGAEDPASFVNFLSTLATNAAAALGAVPHPATGQRSLDLETGKYWLDVLGMLKDKTQGNLHPQESRLVEGLLADLRMQYVTMVRATEEKLKEQAAKKFSGADILGKK